MNKAIYIIILALLLKIEGGIYPLKDSYCIPDTETLSEYFISVYDSQDEMNTIYLGVRPDIITADDFLQLINIWEDKHFEVIMACPSLEYWRKLDETEYPVIMSAYTDFVNTLMSYYESNNWLQDRISIYFCNATEWLVGNSSNYVNDFDVNEGIAHILSTNLHRYQLTLGNYTEVLAEFEALVNSCRTEEETAYPNLSAWDVVFFGDSVIAVPETFSIPGAFSGFTGAHTYNCGNGGSTATVISDADNYPYPGIPQVVDAFLAENLNPFSEGSQIYAGMKDYFEYADKDRQQCFVINFGLNDYFNGCPVSSNDPYDIHTYAGALRTAVEKLQAAYPDAMVILMTPNFTTYFENGLQPQGAGGQLIDYVSTVISTCDEKNLLFYDSYNLLGINSDNYTEYLVDSCHPNESTRYTMAQGLAMLIKLITGERE